MCEAEKKSSRHQIHAEYVETNRMLNTFNLIDGEYDCDGDDDGDDDDRMDVDNETEDGDGSFNHSDRLYLGLGSVLDYDFDNDDLRDPNYQNPLGSSEAAWSGPCILLSSVKCFSINIAPHAIAKDGIEVPLV